MQHELLIQALAQCSYEEDVEALSHFVFHPRYNGASSQCLICHGNSPEANDEGHSDDCEYREAYRRCAKASLEAWVNHPSR